MTVLLLDGVSYEFEGTHLIKAAKFQTGDRKKDDKGREWEFADTKRWRLVRDSNAPAKPAKKTKADGLTTKPKVKAEDSPAKPKATKKTKVALTTAAVTPETAVSIDQMLQQVSQIQGAVPAAPASPAVPAAAAQKPTAIQQAARLAARVQAAPKQAARIAQQTQAKLPTKAAVQAKAKEALGHTKHALIHEGDALSENIVSWKTGKLLGGAIAQYAIAHGANPVATQIISETVVQASTACFIHAIKQKNQGTLDAKEIAGYFVKQVAGAYLGKYAHYGTEFAIDHLGVGEAYDHIAPLVAGKVTGISTVTAMGRYHLDSQIVNAVIDRSKKDINLLLGLFSKKSAAPAAKPAPQLALAKSADGQFSPELQELLWELTQAGIALALHKQAA